MYTQRLTELHSHINSHGCGLVSMAAAVEVFKPLKRITPAQLNSVYKHALETRNEKGFLLMRERSYLQDWAGVFDLLGLKVRYLGHMPRTWAPSEGEFEIVKWILSIPHEGIDWQHFTFGGDTKRHPFFDPWGSAKPGYLTSRTVAEGVIESKRGFRILEDGWQ